MDQDRQIRFVIPLFFLFASLLWGAYLGHRCISPIFKRETGKEVLTLLAAAAVVIVPVGFLISTLSVAILRVLALICRTPTYEAVLSDSTLERIWSQLHCAQAKDKKQTLFAAATFDHELLSAGVHTWLMRRWNSFNVALHSIVALLLAHAVGRVFSIPQICRWWVTTIALIGLLSLAAFNAWRDTMKMVEFQSCRKQKGDAD